MPKRDLDLFLFLIMIFASLVHGLKLPVFNVAPYNIIIPVLAFFLIIFHRDTIGQIINQNKELIIVWSLIWIWMFLTSFLRPLDQAHSLKYYIKYSQYYFLFIAILLYFHSYKNSFFCFLVFYRLMVFLSLVGLVDFFFHSYIADILQIFNPINTSGSYPRISSLLSGPNQFGVLLVQTLLLGLVLNKLQILSNKAVIYCTLLMILLISLSGSRNAYLVFILGVVAAWRFRVISSRILLLLLFTWALTLISLPVPAQRLGIEKISLNPLTWLNQSASSKKINPNGIGNILEKSSKQRFARFEEGLKLWKKSPLTGAGIQANAYLWQNKYNTVSSNAHNLLITIISEQGLVGLFLSVLFSYYLFRHLSLSNSLITLPLFIFFTSQIIDCFLHDFTFMIINFFFLAGATKIDLYYAE